MTSSASAIINPPRLWTGEEILARPTPLPAASGVYGWYFRRAPGETPAADCVAHDGCRLLYVGISPARPGSRQNLRRRLRTHMRGNASGSTLRLTLGVLLSGELGIELQRAGGRLTFGAGEKALSAWIRENAFVTWCATNTPRAVEHELLGLVPLPLNLESNTRTRFGVRLSELRAVARARARGVSIPSRDDALT